MVDVLRRNHVKVIGNGSETMVMAHGFGCDQQMWRYITPALENDYRIVLFDYVGSGQSDLSAYDSVKYGDLQGYAQDVLDVIDALQLQNIIYVGHSVSSMTGLLAAIERPELFNKMIMIGPSACYLNDSKGYVGGFDKGDIVELLDMMEMNFAGWASFMAPLVMDQSKGMTPVRNLEKTFMSGDPGIARQFAEVTFFTDNRDKLSLMKVPTLVIQCSDDSIVPVEAGKI